MNKSGKLVRKKHKRRRESLKSQWGAVRPKERAPKRKKTLFSPSASLSEKKVQ